MPLTVKEIMRAPAVLVRPDDTLERVARAMLQHEVRCVAVVDERQRAVGVIREEEFSPQKRHLPFSNEVALRLFGEWLAQDQVEESYREGREVMARDVMVTGATVSEETRVSDVMNALIQNHNLLVLRGDFPVGTLTRHELLKLVALLPHG